MVKGVKSKKFKCFWVSMFLAALCYPDKPTAADKKRYSTFYYSLLEILPCKFCREFSAQVLKPKFPLDMTNRMTLFYSLYLWKDQVNKKLGKTSIPFETVYKRYCKYYATCDKSVGRCI